MLSYTETGQYRVVAIGIEYISRDAVSLYLVEGFQWNLPQIFIIMWVGHRWKGFQGQRSKVKVMTRRLPYNSRCIHFDSVASSSLAPSCQQNFLFDEHEFNTYFIETNHCVISAITVISNGDCRCWLTPAISYLKFFKTKFYEKESVTYKQNMRRDFVFLLRC